MSHGKLYRSFIILQEDERGHSISGDKPLSGYAKIEAKNDKCKITFYAQNMKKDGEKCSMMLVCCKKGMKQLINLGAVNINDQGKAETSSEFFSNDIGGVGISFDKVSGAALCKDVGGKKIIIMYGFMNGEMPTDDWKSYPVVYSKTSAETKPVETKLVENKPAQEKKEKKENNKEYNNDEYGKHIEKKTDEAELKEEIKVKIEGEVKVEKDRDELSEFDEYERNIEAAKNVEKDWQEEFQVRGSVGEFFTSVVDDYEEERHHKDIKYCKWYNIPVKNFDSMCNVSNYNKYTIIYYPMINYFPYIKKYGHFMIGLKCDEEGKVKYLVYAVPGTKDKADQPYGGKSGFVTWMPDETKGKDMGYWLMFYDFKNSMIVVPMK